eukprot:7389164-Prymnesium_polylepis.3
MSQWPRTLPGKKWLASVSPMNISSSARLSRDLSASMLSRMTGKCTTVAIELAMREAFTRHAPPVR